jgi:hypothetical protein
MPLEYAAAFYVVTGSVDMIRAALDGSGLTVLTEDKMAIYELGGIMTNAVRKRAHR